MQAVVGVLANGTPPPPMKNFLLLIKHDLAGTIILGHTALVATAEARQPHSVFVATPGARCRPATSKLHGDLFDGGLSTAIKGGDQRTCLIDALGHRQTLHRVEPQNKKAVVIGAFGPHMRSSINGGPSEAVS